MELPNTQPLHLPSNNDSTNVFRYLYNRACNAACYYHKVSTVVSSNFLSEIIPVPTAIVTIFMFHVYVMFRSSGGSSSSTGTGVESRSSFRMSRRSSTLQQQPLLTPQFFCDPSSGGLLTPSMFLASGKIPV